MFVTLGCNGSVVNNFVLLNPSPSGVYYFVFVSASVSKNKIHEKNFINQLRYGLHHYP